MDILMSMKHFLENYLVVYAHIQTYALWLTFSSVCVVSGNISCCARAAHMTSRTPCGCIFCDPVNVLI